MIPLKRDRTSTAIHSNFVSPKRDTLNIELMTNQRSVLDGSISEHDFDSNRWKAAKDELKKDSHDKCAYCEAPTSVVAYGDVEHFRPKSVYWWLAYCYDNYLVSCQLCNQKFKGAKFPIAKTKLKPPVNIRKTTTDSTISSRAPQLTPDPLDIAAVSHFEADHDAERPYLVNPYLDDPSDFYAWDVDDTLRRVSLIATPGLADGDKYVKAAEEDLGLNRLELQELRYATLEIFRTFEVVLKDPGISATTRTRVANQILKMQEDNAPFAGMLRFLAT
jgi:uncharacterized protein (TIGR02646 family)